MSQPHSSLIALPAAPVAAAVITAGSFADICRSIHPFLHSSMTVTK